MLHGHRALLGIVLGCWWGMMGTMGTLTGMVGILMGCTPGGGGVVSDDLVTLSQLRGRALRRTTRDRVGRPRRRTPRSRSPSSTGRELTNSVGLKKKKKKTERNGGEVSLCLSDRNSLQKKWIVDGKKLQCGVPH